MRGHLVCFVATQIPAQTHGTMGLALPLRIAVLVGTYAAVTQIEQAFYGDFKSRTNPGRVPALRCTGTTPGTAQRSELARDRRKSSSIFQNMFERGAHRARGFGGPSPVAQCRRQNRWLNLPCTRPRRARHPPPPPCAGRWPSAVRASSASESSSRTSPAVARPWSICLRPQAPT